MPERSFFSDRNETWKPDTGVIRENIPEKVRNFVRSVVKNSNEDRMSEMWGSIVDVLDMDPVLYDFGSGREYNVNQMEEYLKSCSYAEFLDTCEAMHGWFSENWHGIEDQFMNDLNERLIRYYSGYRMEESGSIIEPGSRVSERSIEDARGLLRASEIKGPDRQFQNALLAFHGIPPNYEQAVANAANAVEGVARYVLDDDSVKFEKAVVRIKNEKGLPPALVQSMIKVWGHASDAGGRHGVVGDPKVDRPIAEFCLHHAAASIVLIARSYGIEVVEGG